MHRQALTQKQKKHLNNHSHKNYKKSLKKKEKKVNTANRSVLKKVGSDRFFTFWFGFSV